MNEHQFIIEPEQISEEALNRIMEDFILREGTEYGLNNHSLDTKRAQVMLQLKSKKVFILYDNELNSCNLMTSEQIKKLSDS